MEYKKLKTKKIKPEIMKLERDVSINSDKGEGHESGYHSFFPYSIVNQKSNNEKLTGYFVFCFSL